MAALSKKTRITLLIVAGAILLTALLAVWGVIMVNTLTRHRLMNSYLAPYSERATAYLAENEAFTEKYGDVVGIMTVDAEGEDLILISSGGIIIRMAMDEIRLCSRVSKGVRVMRVPEGTAIVSIASAEHDEAEVNAHAEETDSADEGAEELDAPETTEE